MLSERAVKKYLEHIKSIKTAHDLIDVHVHPFEVIFNNLTYKTNPNFAGVYSFNGSKYGCPEISGIGDAPIQASHSCRRVLSDEIRYKCLLLAMRQAYLHTGPQVFIDQMLLSGIDRVLLLPVSSEGLSMDQQMNMMAEMFGHDDRFVFGFSVPCGIKNNQIKTAIDDAIQQYSVKAIKLHPALSDINLQERDGLERVDSILRSCHENGLSMIIHGGKSPDIKGVEKTSFGELCNLDRVNWSLSGNPVVIAHAGIYGCDESNLKTLVQRLNNIIAKHDNVMIDLSGIGFKGLNTVLSSVDPARVVFGSDSLYYQQWKSIVLLYHSLKDFYDNVDEQFIRITSTNPSRILRGGARLCTK